MPSSTKHLEREIQISLSYEHAHYISQIKDCFRDLDIDIDPSYQRLSAGELPMQIMIYLGEFILTGVAYDLLKLGIQKVLKKFQDAKITIRHQGIFYTVDQAGKVFVCVIPDREKEFEHIQTIDDLISHIQNSKSSSSWQETMLGETVEKIAMGPFGSNIKVATFLSEGIPIISGDHLRGIRLEDKEYNFISEEHANRLKGANVYRGDVIFTHAGNIGQVAYIPNNSKFERYVISQRQFYLRCNTKKLSPEFVTYYFKSREGQHKLLANASQAGVPSIARPASYLKSLTIPLPPLIEQRAIAAILSSLDDKIELLREQNKTLEETAQAIFREWFGRYSVDRPEELPRGWRVGRLGDEFEIIMGQSPSGESYNEQGDGMIFFQGRAEFQDRFPKTRLYTTEPKRMAEKFDVLVSVRAPVGDINVASEECCIGRGLAAVRGENTSYTLYKIKSLKEVFDKFEAEGTVFGSINKNSFSGIAVVIPMEELTGKFENVVNPLDQKIFNNYSQIQTLSTLRDELLPRLMQGKMMANKLNLVMP